MFKMSKKEYIQSCRLLEGFEDCKICGIKNCKDNLCPPEEKILSMESLTADEYSWQKCIYYLNKDVELTLKGSFNSSINYIVKRTNEYKNSLKKDNTVSDKMKIKFLDMLDKILFKSKEMYE